jgi:hypothetical protein
MTVYKRRSTHPIHRYPQHSFHGLKQGGYPSVGGELGWPSCVDGAALMADV